MFVFHFKICVCTVEILLVVTACTVNFGITSAQLYSQTIDQAITTNVNNDGKMQENFENFFDSIAKKDIGRREAYRQILKQEIVKERRTFDAMKHELRIARNRNSYTKKKFNGRSNIDENAVAVKRETTEDKRGPLHTPRAKRTKCKISELKNTSLEFGECMVTTDNCTVYWCCDETDRFGELIKYQCEFLVLRLYPLLTRECREKGCIPKFTWDDSYLTESPYERTMSKNPIIEKITEGIILDNAESAETKEVTTEEAVTEVIQR